MEGQKLIVAFDESPISRTQVQLWFNRFNGGREDANISACLCPGSPSISTTNKNVEAVKKIILDNRRITIK